MNGPTPYSCRLPATCLFTIPVVIPDPPVHFRPGRPGLDPPEPIANSNID
ncbi:hypothetical protein Aco03nite_070690 [Actinoplanes couchii]|uniref:Uncharacterized protein n=1 Tax=Actinoplanes couchii TaxID=403638 RepID=A0ABQ3XJT2_9ACTN|nr:hypothetical protein Aco03nite_070690 [Actinoplanes couchii]